MFYDSATQKNEFLFRILGKFIEGLAGRYITAEERLKSVGRISNIYTGKSDFSGRLGKLYVR